MLHLQMPLLYGVVLGLAVAMVLSVPFFKWRYQRRILQHALALARLRQRSSRAASLAGWAVKQASLYTLYFNGLGCAAGVSRRFTSW